MAKKKKLKKSRAKKLKRVEEKIKKIDKILTGEKYVTDWRSNSNKRFVIKICSKFSSLNFV